MNQRASGINKKEKKIREKLKSKSVSDVRKYAHILGIRLLVKDSKKYNTK